MRIDWARILVLLFVGSCLPSEARAGDGWALEFGGYSGFYDFDRVSQFEDKAVIGARVGLQAGERWRVETEFDEVYTRRAVSNNAARQVSLALHLRYEPLRGRWSPSLFAGMAFVGFDDQDDPDSYGEGIDLGLGLRHAFGEAWVLRADWMLRRQSVLLHRQDGTQEDLEMYGRSYRLGVAYAF